jgi:hypothetical protein
MKTFYKKLIICSCILATTSFAFAESPNCYRIIFSDKNNSPYSINRPEEFLSPRAIAKRVRFNIPIIEQDLPINPQYIEAILNFSSEPSQIISKSKWDNSVVIFYPDTENSQSIIDEMVVNFPFVVDALPVAYYQTPFVSAPPPIQKQMNDSVVYLSSSCDYDYGKSIDNIALHKGELLHKAGFCGEGMLICVFDAGWNGFDTISYFKPLYQNGQILGTRDLVPGVNNVYIGHTHGTAITSQMASNIDEKMVGTAPKANYFLIRSENEFPSGNEQLIEEDFYAYAAEIADSLGADVVNASLGYYKFNYEWQNIYTSDDNDGTKSIASRAASILAHKGIILVNAAGNEGQSTWHYIIRPADAFDILSVGAVRINSVPVQYSSYGPSADGRIKPDVAALGWNNWVIRSDGKIYGGNTGWMGTSCATPIIAGLAACLWQALPQYSSFEIMQLIKEYSDCYNTPNDRTGYGIPNFYQCYLEHTNSVPKSKTSTISVYPNPTAGVLRIKSGELSIDGIEIFDILGRMQNIKNGNFLYPEMKIDISHLPSGIYFVKIVTESSVEIKKVLKN